VPIGFPKAVQILPVRYSVAALRRD